MREFFNVEHDSCICANEIARDVLKLLDDNESHRYLQQKRFSIHLNNSTIDFNNLKRSIQISFCKRILLYINISIRLELQYCDTNIDPIVLVGTAILTTPGTHLQKFNNSQKNMMRRSVE